jgi:hypothetical protein
MIHTHPNIWRFIHTIKNEEQHIIQKNVHQLIGGGGTYATTGRKRAQKAAKKTCQIIKLDRLFAENKKTLEELILGFSFLVGEPISKKKKKKMKKNNLV